MQDKIFPLNLVLIYIRPFQFAYEEANWTVPKWIALNHIMQSQTKACITKSSCEICTLLGHNAAKSGNSLLMFWDNLLVLSSRVMKSKTEQSMTEVNCLKLFFWDFVQCLFFFKEAHCFGSWLCFCFQAEQPLTWWTAEIKLFPVNGHHQNSNLL